MGCKSFGVNQILVGLYRVGVTGLADAFKKAEESGLEGQGPVVDFLLQSLAPENYIPDALLETYRTALWREYLRYRGKDFSRFYSDADVTVRGEPGEKLDGFLQMTASVFADFELRPVVTLEPPAKAGADPQLVVRGETIVSGCASRAAFKAAVQKSFTDW